MTTTELMPVPDTTRMDWQKASTLVGQVIEFHCTQLRECCFTDEVEKQAAINELREAYNTMMRGV